MSHFNITGSSVVSAAYLQTASLPTSPFHRVFMKTTGFFKMFQLFWNNSTVKYTLFIKTTKAPHPTKEQIFHSFSNDGNFLIKVPQKQNYQPVVAAVDSLFVWHGAPETAWQTPWLQGCLQDRLWCNRGPHKEILLPSGRKQMWELQEERKIIDEVSASIRDVWKPNQEYFAISYCERLYTVCKIFLLLTIQVVGCVESMKHLFTPLSESILGFVNSLEQLQ